MPNAITVLIADDHKLVREGVRVLLEAQEDIDVIGEAGSGEAAVEAAREHAPDVALMDLLLPGVSGTEATRRLKAVSPRTNVVVLTSYHGDDHIVPALQAGALSYLLKSSSAETLVDAVRRAARGEAVLEPSVAAQVVRTVQSGPTAPAPYSELSARELEVLRLIAEGLGNGEIGQRLFISEKTVKSHVGNILAKLHLADRTQAAVFAWREKLIS